MDVADVKKRKIELEAAIKELLIDFENETLVSIESISTDVIDFLSKSDCEPNNMHTVKVKINL